MCVENYKRLGSAHTARPSLVCLPAVKISSSAVRPLHLYLSVHSGFVIRIIATGSYHVNHSGTACVHPAGTTLRRVDFLKRGKKLRRNTGAHAKAYSDWLFLHLCFLDSLPCCAFSHRLPSKYSFYFSACLSGWFCNLFDLQRVKWVTFYRVCSMFEW